MSVLLSVPVCRVAWYDDSESFVAGFMDGVICLATKDPENQVKIVEAHKVRSSEICSTFLQFPRSEILTNEMLLETKSPFMPLGR